MAMKGNKNAAGPRKSEDQKRIGMSVSISDTYNQQLTRLRKHLAFYMRAEPTTEDIKNFARGLWQSSIEDYLNSPLVPDPEWGEGE
jgi:DNA primase